MNGQQIVVVKQPSETFRVEIKIRQGDRCANCGKRKSTRRFLGKFLCSECRQDTLDEKDEKDGRSENS